MVSNFRSADKDFPGRVLSQTMCRGDLSVVIARLMMDGVEKS